MAIVVNNLITSHLRGKLGKQVVFKRYGNITVACAYPRPSLKPPTNSQLAQRKKFAQAVFSTRYWLTLPHKKQFLEGLALKWSSKSAYHAGIKHFMQQPEQTPTPALPLQNTNTKNTAAATTKRVAKPAKQNPTNTQKTNTLHKKGKGTKDKEPPPA